MAWGYVKKGRMIAQQHVERLHSLHRATPLAGTCQQGKAEAHEGEEGGHEAGQRGQEPVRDVLAIEVMEDLDQQVRGRDPTPFPKGLDGRNTPL